ncbi:MAG: SGNH/GDSL hydrolase family protein [Actinomycetota bacterium]|nr:SGNH/GDSL hydrolase family protein [Actinomycetota bacterium]
MGKKLLLLILVLLALNGSGTVAAKAQTGTEGAKRKQIWMMGRSVMAGWFAHMGSDGIRPVKRGRFVFTYKAIAPPPKIVNSVRKHLAAAERRPMVFFKLCFVDFEGGTQEDAQANLTRNKTYIRRAYRVVVTTYHKRLIIGNALPKVAGETDTWLVWNHQQYNAWLNGFAAGHPGQVYIFSMYDVLRDGSGNLRADYATSASDSHPNDAGYSALDAVYLPFLRSNF